MSSKAYQRANNRVPAGLHPVLPATLPVPTGLPLMLARLAPIRNCIFDLDNTLYPADVNMFVQVDRRMTGFIADLLGVGPDEARRLQKGWFAEHGTTLAGLMREHAVDPHVFLAHVHDVEMTMLAQNAPLAAAIARLPGRKLVFTNGDRPYALKVLDRLGLGDSFEAIHDLHAMDLVPKPSPSAYAGLCAAFDLDPAVSLFADDMARNLVPAKAIGMTTLWVDNGSEQASSEQAGAGRDHIDFTTGDVSAWLHDILEDA